MSYTTSYLIDLQITRLDTRTLTKWTVSQVVTDDQFNLLEGFWVGMYGLTYSLEYSRGRFVGIRLIFYISLIKTSREVFNKFTFTNSHSH